MLIKKIRYNFSLVDRLNKFKPPAKIEKKPQKYYPIQHPEKIDSHNSSLFTHDKPLHYITPRFESPQIDLYRDGNYGLTEIDQPPNPKSLEIAILGAPNAGKSSLLNTILKSQISAVSNKQNTTYDSILGIHTNKEKQTQLLFYDTPGITKHFKHSKNYTTKAWDILNQVQKAIFLIDGVKTLDDKVREALKRLNKFRYNEQIDRKIESISDLSHDDLLYKDKLQNIINQDHQIQTQINENNQLYSAQTFPKILVVNKMDLCTNKKKLNWIVSEIEDLSKFDHKFFISCETGFGVNQLIEYLESEALPQKWKRHSLVKCDLSKVEIIEQIMKSALFLRYFEELPYQIGVTLKEFSQRSDGQYRLHFELDVDTESQKKIVTGHHARNIAELISYTKIELIKLFQQDFEITIKVKLRKESLARENFKSEEITSENYADKKAEYLFKQAKENRKQIIDRLESFLQYPLLK